MGRKGSTLVHDKEILLLVVTYVSDSGEEKTCNGVLKMSIGRKEPDTSSPMTASNVLSLKSCADDMSIKT